MKKHYVTGKQLSLWMRLVQKWNALYHRAKVFTNIKQLDKLNRVSLLLGVNRKLVLTSLAGALTIGANAQVAFEEVTDTNKMYFDGVDVGNSASPIFADVDNDGNTDLVVGNRDGELKFFDGGDSFIEKTGTDNPFDSIDVGKYSRPAFADLDGDGDLDLVVGADDGKLNYYTNNNAVFTQQIGVNNPFDAFTLSNVQKPNSGNFYTTRANPVFVDLDDDGDQDLVLGDYLGSDRYYTSNGSAKYLSR